jgi:4-amino-4-deoxy-L-arabinose transferase-like glycosyltransferase
MIFESLNKNRLLHLIIIATVIRSLIAFSIPLGNDEAYYFTYALQPDLNHFDHPPLVGFFIRIFTGNLHWVNEFSMRLTSIISAAISTVLIAACGRLIRNRQTGFIAALLFTVSPYTSVISGVFILPDSPQLVFWMASLYWMLKLISNQHSSKSLLVWLGIWIGLASMCKIHGLFLWLGFGAYILFFDRQWLKNPYLYLSVLISILILSPVLFWNMENHFIVWQFQRQRVEVGGGGINIKSLLIMLSEQIFYNNPVNIVLAIIAIRQSAKHRQLSSRYFRLLLLCGLPLICLATCISLFRSTLSYWSGPGFTGLMLVTASILEGKLKSRHTRYAMLLTTSIIFILVTIVFGAIIVKNYPGTIGKKREPFVGKGDFTLDRYGWDDIKQKFNSLRNTDIEEKRMRPNAPLLVNKWFPGGHICFYIAYPLGMRTVGYGKLNDLHKFAWLNSQQGLIYPGQDAYFITPSNYFSDPLVLYKDAFDSISLPDVFMEKRNGSLTRYWYVYRLKHARKKLGEFPD